MFNRNRSNRRGNRNVLQESIRPCVEALEVRTLLSVPNGPFGLTATAASPTSVNLAFYDSATDETGFVVQKSTTQNGTYATVTTLPASSGTGAKVTYTDPNDVGSTTYFYKVYAINGSGQSSATSASVTTPAGGPPTAPAAPSGVSAALSGSNVVVSFTDNSNNENDFVILRSTTSNGTYTSVGTVTGDSSTGSKQFTDKTAAANTTYYYEVYAENAVGPSSTAGPSNSVTTPPPPTVPVAPSGVSAALSGSQVTVTFTDNSNNETDFVILRSTAVSGTYASVGTVAGDGVTGTKNFTDTTVAAGTTYYYEVYAENSAGPSTTAGPSNGVTTSSQNPGGAPNGPFGLTATASSANAVNLVFYDTATNETGFTVQRSLTQNGTYTTVANLPPAAGSGTKVTYTDTTTVGSTTYYYKVFAVNGVYSSSSTTGSVTTPAGGPPTAPAAPSGVSAALSGSNVVVSFTDNSNNENDFVILRSTTSNGTYTSVGTVTGDSSTGSKQFTDKTAAANTTYYYEVYAENAVGPSSTAGPSNSVTTPPPPTVPVAPSGVSAALSGSQVTVTFTDNSNNETDFVILRSTAVSGTYASVGTVAGDGVTGTKNFTDTTVAAGTTYYYEVYAENSAGPSTTAGPSNGVTTSSQNPGGPPNGPFGFTATAISAGSVSLSFYDSATNETGFVIQRSLSQNGTYTTVGNLPPAAGSGTQVTYTDNTTAGSTTYYYRLYAVNGVYDSGVSSTSVTTPGGATAPAAPSGLTAALSGPNIFVSFTDNSTNEVDFVVQRSTSVGGPYTTVKTIAGDATTGTKSFTDNTVSASTTYYYEVYAENAVGPSAVVGPTTGVTTPAAGAVPVDPSNLTAALSGSNINVSFMDNSTNEVDFVVQRATSVGGPYTTVKTISGDAVTGTKSFIDTTVSASTTYYYKVYAENAIGPSDVIGPTSGVTTPPSATAPAAPSGLTAVATGPQIALSFTDNSNNETDFVIQRSTSVSGPFSTITTLPGDSTTGLELYTDTNIVSGTTYYYQVFAENGSIKSAFSGPTSGTAGIYTPFNTTTNPGGPPSGPYGLTASPINSGTVQIQWVDNSSNENGFVITRSTSAAGPFVQVGTAAGSAVTHAVLSFIDVGVNPSSTYYYEVYAVNGPYNSGVAGPASVTTPSVAGSNTPTGSWVPYATLIGQDKEVSDYPNINGSGVTVVTIDRGVDYNAPGLSPSKFIAGYNFRDNNTNILDDYGHGTGVSGIIGANGYTYNGQYNQGVAPGVNLIMLKQESSAEIKEALDWVIANAATYHIEVVNLTDFVTDVQAGAYNPSVYLSELQTIYNMGIFIATPVGNGEVQYGPDAPIGYPALSPYVVGVGGVNQDGTMYADGLRGNGLDILGPANHVTMPYYIKNPNATGYDSNDDNYTGSGAIVNYALGTSWASAYISGTAALLKQVNPAITPAEILSILQQTGTTTSDPENPGTTYPMVNIDKAVGLAEQLYGPNGTSTP